MNDLDAGIVCGFIMGLFFVGAGAIMVPSYRSELEASLRRFSRGFLLSVLAVAVVFVSMVAWSLIGLLLARLYRWSSDTLPMPGLGSPNLPFTAAIAFVALAMTVSLLLTQKKGIWERLIMNGAFALLFGWLLPILAR